MLQAIRDNMTWRAVPIAGLAGGTAFLALVLVLAPAWLGVDDAVILYYFASLVMGTDVLVAQANLPVLLVGVLVHYVFSLLFGLLIAIVVHRWGLLVGIVGGAVLGASLYAINLYTMTLFVPWFFAINSSLLFLAHVVYGAVTGGVYESLDRFDVGIQPEVAHERA